MGWIDQLLGRILDRPSVDRSIVWTGQSIRFFLTADVEFSTCQAKCYLRVYAICALNAAYKYGITVAISHIHSRSYTANNCAEKPPQPEIWR